MLLRTFILFTATMMIASSQALAEEKIDYEKQIQPIFMQHCAGCHGEAKALGKMRLHTAAALKEKWDADDHLIVAGDAEKSELYARLVLPADNPKRMPKKADPLPKETIDLIAAWIKQGAVLPGAVAAAAEAKPQAAAAGEEKAKSQEDLPLPEVAAAPQEGIDALTAAGAQVLPLFAGSNLLQVSFAHRTEPVGDAEVALLSGVAEQVYALNLTAAKASDAGLAPLAGLKNLSALHLERSSVTDAGLAHLAGLANLQYLNVYGTAVSDAGLAHLAALKHLRRLYLWQTKASYETAMAMEKDIPGLVVNLGYNHPAVVRMRLTKDLELVKQQAEEAKAELTKAEQQLEGAKKSAEAANTRLSEVEKQLQELEAPAAEAEEKKVDSTQAAN
jgi:mono/diheme cytochrome c family protein